MKVELEQCGRNKVRKRMPGVPQSQRGQVSVRYGTYLTLHVISYMLFHASCTLGLRQLILMHMYLHAEVNVVVNILL